jgi:glycosyltransferase involved in cell wall biosynthesis
VTRLRIGIDGRAFGSPAAGVRRYVGGLVSGLLALDEPLTVVALGGRAELLPPGVEHVSEPAHPPTNLGWTLVGLPRAAARAGVDLVHAPAYTAPFWCRVPVVVTIHDVSYERHPEWYPYRRDWLRRAFYRRSATSAAHVITDSAFSADEIHAAYGLPRTAISVVPLAATPRAAGGGGAGPAGPSRGVQAAGAAEAGASADRPHSPSVRSPFLLHVGDLHVRRNLPVAIDALALARAQGRALANLTLVTAGVDRGQAGLLRARAASAGIAQAFVMLGAVPEAELERLYRAASALVYPSLYEGFGLPVLEAMASGTPVIASRAASMPEVLGDAGMLIEPTDVAAWADAIVRVVTDPAWHRELQDRGRARAAGFSWERTARLTLDVYRRVLAA